MKESSSTTRGQVNPGELGEPCRETFGTDAGAEIAVNHAMDHLLKKYVELSFGLDITETTFPEDEKLNELLVDGWASSLLRVAQGDEKLSRYITLGNLSVSDVLQRVSVFGRRYYYKVMPQDELSDFIVPSVQEVPQGEDVVVPQEITEEALRNFRALASSRIYSPRVMYKSILSPKLFDRVFSIAVDPDEFEIDVDATMRNKTSSEQFKKDVFSEITEEVILSDGRRITKLKPRKTNEGLASFNDFFIHVAIPEAE